MGLHCHRLPTRPPLPALRHASAALHRPSPPPSLPTLRRPDPDPARGSGTDHGGRSPARIASMPRAAAATSQYNSRAGNNIGRRLRRRVPAPRRRGPGGRGSPRMTSSTKSSARTRAGAPGPEHPHPSTTTLSIPFLPFFSLAGRRHYVCG